MIMSNVDFKFQLYTKRNEQVKLWKQAALIEGRYDDDAIWPCIRLFP